MNIMEALRSGRRFKRPHYPKWCGLKDYLTRDQTLYDLKAADILADDWEIEEERIEITASELARAWDASSYAGAQRADMNPFFRQIIRALGFKGEKK